MEEKASAQVLGPDGRIIADGYLLEPTITEDPNVEVRLTTQFIVTDMYAEDYYAESD